jgi:hypothetical protein
MWCYRTYGHRLPGLHICLEPFVFSFFDSDKTLVRALLLQGRSYMDFDHFIVATQRSMYNTKQEGRWAFQIHVLNIQTSQLLAAKLIFHNVIQSFYCPPPFSKPSNHYSFAINPLASGALFSCPCLSFRASFPLKGFGLLAPQTLPPSKKPSYVVLKSSPRASGSQRQEVK